MGWAHLVKNSEKDLQRRGFSKSFCKKVKPLALFNCHVFHIDPLLFGDLHLLSTAPQHKTSPRAVHVLRETSGENLITQWLL